MSVSLRDRICEIVEKYQGNQWGLRIADEVIPLFPPQLTEEEVEKVLPKKKELGDCLNCKTNRQMGYQQICPECREKIAENKIIDDCKSALIGKCGNIVTNDKENRLTLRGHVHKEVENWWVEIHLPESGMVFNVMKKDLATPTFSGGREKRGEIIDKSKAVGCVKCIKEKMICLVGHCSFKPKPTEQKEYCKCPTPIHEGDKCMDCGKPIPAEKKEETPTQRINERG